MNVPHACGDEPVTQFMCKTNFFMFPTPVGMNRSMTLVRVSQRYVPHACGDEPYELENGNISGPCSPRLWG